MLTTANKERFSYKPKVGDRHGNLTVTKHLSGNTWECKCDCGNVVAFYESRVKKASSCGCRIGFSKIKNDLSGKRFGRLTVTNIGKDKKTKTGKRVVHWDCVCDCGNTCTVSAAHLVTGHTKSCGCFHDETVGKNNFRHGMSDTKAYKAYQYIMSRCCNSNNTVAYNQYGAKGIKISDEWKGHPNVFCEYVMNLDGYDDPEKKTIDRIDGKKGYCPGNVRWASYLVQNNNKKSNVRLSLNGRTQTAAMWSRELGINISTITYRRRKGYSDEDCLKKHDLRRKKDDIPEC